MLEVVFCIIRSTSILKVRVSLAVFGKSDDGLQKVSVQMMQAYIYNSAKINK